MKKKIVWMCLLWGFALTACGSKSVSEPVETYVFEEIDTAIEEQTQEAVSEAGSIEETGVAEYVILDNPSWEYYIKDENIQKAQTTICLEELTKQENQITDTEKWFTDNGLEMSKYTSNGINTDGLVCTLTVQDDSYQYDLLGDNYASAYILKMYDKNSGNLVKTFDFSGFRYADDFDEAERDYVEQRIWWAQTKGGVLYVSVGHNTYAESSPHSGYVMAIDLKDTSVIWKTKPLVSNSYTFEIIEENIVCGYGFTAEEDWLYILDLHTGKVAEQISMDSKADYIIQKDDILYVRTYNKDYTYKLIR